MPNRLIHEVSPYLLQHAHNPVDWYAWGDEALGRARTEDKPILLSIGYSACHWCHVMERESFEDEATAALMNDRFVSIKVDREERPDLDAIYMAAVQGLTGHGGWPMTVFLTPEGKPFYGGTYFPPDDRGGMPGFKKVLTAISEAYRSRREEVNNQADVVVNFIREQAQSGAPAESLDSTVLDAAFLALRRQFDATHGGFGGAPKFPQAMALEFLLHYHHRSANSDALAMAETTLARMAAGGMYDQIGGGFHRYSVDDRWLVPHFEKMLYDNALLACAYLHAYQVTGRGFYRQVAQETLDYVLRDMQDAEGGFYSAQDADSEGEEGAFYLWTPETIREAVGPDDAQLVCLHFGVGHTGPVEGKSTLTRPLDPEAFAASAGVSVDELGGTVGRARQALLEARRRRVPPATDDKVLAAWNGLMLRSFAEAYRALGEPRYRAAAEANAEFLLAKLWSDGRLLRVYRAGTAAIDGYLEDYGALADGLLALYEATFELRWFLAARDVAAALVDRFWNPDEQVLRDTARGADQLMTRPKERWDNATPSGTSVACQVLLRLWALTGKDQFEAIARTELARLATWMAEHPTGLGNALSALAFYLGPPDELAVVGDPGDPATAGLLGAVRSRYLPHLVLAAASPADEAAQQAIPLLQDRPLQDGRPAAYVCHGQVCDLPTTDPDQLLDQLRASH